ncbi:MAG TPA: heavy-metal-associated domain-containing protein [Clostridiales bacterium]|nr:heavy-metal-associated domain-containing protein [Clostridiales bacterium]
MRKKLIIEGMSCSHCVDHVTEALGELPGVESVKVDIDDMSAEVELTDNIEEEDFRNVIDDIGYELIEVEDI